MRGLACRHSRCMAVSSLVGGGDRTGASRLGRGIGPAVGLLALATLWAGAPTRITGRVVGDDGEGVPGAIVFLPELGLQTPTDGDGAFQFDSVEDARVALELTIGATVHGRARSAATLVALDPLGTS